MNPIRVFLSLCDAIHLAIIGVLAPVADQIDAEHSQGGQSQPSQPPAQAPRMPVPFAGEPSEDFAMRFPAGIPCTIPAGLKFDPWFVLEADGVFSRGAWIPALAPFTAPVG